MPNEWEFVTAQDEREAELYTKTKRYTNQIKKIKRTFKEFYALEKKSVSINELDAVRKEAKLDILESLFNFLFDDDITEE